MSGGRKDRGGEKDKERKTVLGRRELRLVQPGPTRHLQCCNKPLHHVHSPDCHIFYFLLSCPTGPHLSSPGTACSMFSNILSTFDRCAPPPLPPTPPLAESVDTTLLSSVLSFLSCMSSVLWSLVVVVIVSPVMLAMLVPLSVAYYYLQVSRGAGWVHALPMRRRKE